MTVITAVVVGSFILSTFGKAVDWLEPIEQFSLTHHFDATTMVHEGLAANDLVVLGTIIITSTIFGLIGFRRRDID